MPVNRTTTNERAIRDIQLVDAARTRGDQQAIQTLMKSYRDSVYMLLLKMVNDPDLAEDLTMVTFGKAFSSLDLYTPTNNFSTWLFTIATHVGLDESRKKRIETVSIDNYSVTTSDNATEIEIPSNDADPEADIIRQQRFQQLREVVTMLKPRYRHLVELRYFEELSYEEIAERTGLPPGTVSNMLYRAHGLLYKLLKNRIDYI